MLQLNHELAKKVIISDLIKQKMQSLKISDKFLEAEGQLDNQLPRLACVFAMSLSNTDFMKLLEGFNIERNSKVTYSVATILQQMMTFMNKVVKNDKNGYNGYKFSIKQISEDAVDADTAASVAAEGPIAVNDESKRVYLQVEIDHLDWKSIKDSESKETFDDYKKSLGLFINLTDTTTDLTRIFKIDLLKLLNKEEEVEEKTEQSGKFRTQLSIKINDSGDHRFKVLFCDNYGFTYN